MTITITTPIKRTPFKVLSKLLYFIHH